jgi:hypothetical protein
MTLTSTTPPHQVQDFFYNKYYGIFNLVLELQHSGESTTCTLGLDSFTGKYTIQVHKGTASIGAWGVPQDLKLWQLLMKVRTTKGAQTAVNNCFDEMEHLGLIAVTTARQILA